MQAFTITLKNSDSFEHYCEPIRCGLPFPPGKLHSINQLSFEFDGEALLPCEIKTTAHWPDGSIKWLLVIWTLSIKGQTEKKITCNIATDESKTADGSPDENHSGFQVSYDDDRYRIKTSNVALTINKKPLSTFSVTLSSPDTNSEITELNLSLIDSDKFAYDAKIAASDITSKSNIATISSNGAFYPPQEKTSIASDKEFLQFSSELVFYAKSKIVELSVTLRNPHAAEHPSGLWDLGDKGSRYIQSLSLQLPWDSKEIQWKTAPHNDWQKRQWNDQRETHWSICQYASGGNQWNNPTHIDKHSRIPWKKNGFEVFSSDASSITTQIDSGQRATPIIAGQLHGAAVSIGFDKFWQNFPNAISIKESNLALELFPSEACDEYEIQAGEQKTKRLLISLDPHADALNWISQPIVPIIDTEWLVYSQALPFFSSETSSNLDTLIHAGIEGENNFFEKRESADEFGWRHFGDLYADHESLNYEGDSPIVSHYNNQYDPIYGFARQYLHKGDDRWFWLMDDLARHVIDIDIYHTDKDRIEYNNGLFWHTDHYLDASTSTHRTFSKNHTLSSEGTIGGGPGNEHCYSQGLMYHYFLTGNEASKQTVLQLAEWIDHVHNGSPTVFAWLNQLLTKDRKTFTALLKKQNISAYRYPLTRGTGNYISTLLDAYSLTNDATYLIHVEKIIQETIHPNDNLESRQLHNIEVAWSYTIFLQALIKYIQIKEKTFSDKTQRNSEKAFEYARHVLIRYAEWMLEYEYPYLEKPEVLEHPNHTWAAQDIRKMCIFYAAYVYSNGSINGFKKRAIEFRDYVSTELKQTDTRTFTRILALLMQSHGPHLLLEASDQQNATDANYAPINYTTFGKPPEQKLLAFLTSRATALAKALSRLSFRQEKAWLYQRLGKYQG